MVRLVEQFFALGWYRNPKLIQVYREEMISVGGRKFPVLLVNIDTYRLMYSFEAIARALIFHDFNFRYEGRCTVVSDIFGFTDNKKSNRLHTKGTRVLNEERKLWHTRINGDNPKIFTYQFSDLMNMDTFSVALTFYERTVVYVVMSFLEEYYSENTKKQLSLKLDDFLRSN